MPLAMASSAQMRISALLVTLSFQRYCSSRPMPKRPMMGLSPMVARYSLADLPTSHGAARPWRAWRSAASMGARRLISMALSGLDAPLPLFGTMLDSGLMVRISPFHRSMRSIDAGGGIEVFAAVLAVAIAGAVPAVHEDAVGVVAGHDLFVHGGHEFEVVRAEGAGDPHLRRGPVTARISLGVYCDAVWVRGLGVVIGCVRIGADEHRHAKFAAAGDEFAEHVAIVEPGAAVMKRNLGGIVSDATSTAETDAVGARALEVVEPEGGVEVGWIVLDQCELRPTHGFGRPGGSNFAACGWNDLAEQVRRDVRNCGAGAGDCSGLKKLAARKRGW